MLRDQETTLAQVSDDALREKTFIVCPQPALLLKATHRGSEERAFTTSPGRCPWGDTGFVDSVMGSWACGRAAGACSQKSHLSP